MHKHPHTGIPPQKDTLTLEQAQHRVSNWHDLAGQVYDTTNSRKNMPHGIFIPFADILEISKLQQLFKYEPGTDKRIYIVGVRAYYCLKSKLLTTIPPTPISAIDYPIESVLVPVYQKNHREPGSSGEYDYNPHHLTYDLITGVPSVNDKDEPGDAGDSTIYDVTQPCPQLCDSTSLLF